MGINLRVVKKEDVDILFDWANDPVTRKNSFSEEPINYQTHVKWFNSCMENPYCIQFLLEIDDKVVGQARLNINNNDEALISYSIAPNYRCRGYAKILLYEVTKWCKVNMPSIKSIIADVKPDNLASQEVLLSNNYIEKYRHFELMLDDIFGDKSDEKIDVGGVLHIRNLLYSYIWLYYFNPTKSVFIMKSIHQS